MAENKKNYSLKIVLKKPHLSEKATFLKDSSNAYVFVVNQDSNKNTIAKEIELMYKVKVINVRTVNLPSKPKNLGRTKGKVSGFKKAIVSLAKGQSINVI